MFVGKGDVTENNPNCAPLAMLAGLAINACPAIVNVPKVSVDAMPVGDVVPRNGDPNALTFDRPVGLIVALRNVPKATVEAMLVGLIGNITFAIVSVPNVAVLASPVGCITGAPADAVNVPNVAVLAMPVGYIARV